MPLLSHRLFTCRRTRRNASFPAVKAHTIYGHVVNGRFVDIHVVDVRHVDVHNGAVVEEVATIPAPAIESIGQNSRSRADAAM